ncbi:MAG: peptide-methionine (S)-S-oxide reductase MsrA [Candidatus Pacebacteria bacterium]|nr:peptide-methionine (S)-S-oxide reductase MsrA [Candidatus Paceibacterota bacterium]
MKTLVLGGGCFWCLDPVFQKVPGVTMVRVGYAGGKEKNPSYREVAYGRTGHAEVLEISYDESLLSLKELLKIFFTMHDPTTLNQQGADKGTQYRSIVFYSNDEELSIISELIKELDNSGAYENLIVTEIKPFTDFYPAEEEHQDYFNKNPEQAYCQIVIAPKMEKFSRVFNK